MTVDLAWRGNFTNPEVNELHAQAFGPRILAASERNWQHLTRAHSLGWVTARSAGRLVGFVNVLWDGLMHAWIQDVMVAAMARRDGIGSSLVAEAVRGAREAGATGCMWISRATSGRSTSALAGSPPRTPGSCACRASEAGQPDRLSPL